MKRGELDGNAIAADAYYEQDRPEDYDFCDACGREFDPDGEDHDMSAPQHSVMFMLCVECGDEMEDAE